MDGFYEDFHQDLNSEAEAEMAEKFIDYQEKVLNYFENEWSNEIGNMEMVATLIQECFKNDVGVCNCAGKMAEFFKNRGFLRS